MGYQDIYWNNLSQSLSKRVNARETPNPFLLILGSEWDYVILSLVRSMKTEELDPDPSLSWLREHLGFLTDEHQMNVGLTRARKGLCVIGKH